jgi:indolepyruvate ferredoxin oxidoreductase, beta subunit
MMETMRLIIVAVGGQGNLLTARVIGEAALAADIPVRMSEIHGMAQRGGVVESAIVFGDADSPIISDGEADLLVGFEPSETLRGLPRCNSKTVVVTNVAPTPPFTVAIGRGVYPDLAEIDRLLREKTARVVSLDAAALAREAGNLMAVNMVLLGAAAGTDKLPLTPADLETAIETRTRKDFVETNRRAFTLGLEAARAAA